MYLFRFLIFLLTISSQHGLFAIEHQDQVNEQSNEFTVKNVKRFVDLDTNEYSFKVTLNNNHEFVTSAPLEDLLNSKIYQNQVFILISEEFLAAKPWISEFTYQSLDGYVQLHGQFDSVNSHWSPSGSEKIVSIIKKIAGREFGANNYLVYFSDNSIINDGNVYRNGNIGDLFFQAQPPIRNVPTILVGVIDGHLILGRYGKDNQRSIPVTW